MISNTGYKDIYERLFANFDFCKENGINFQFRCVIPSTEQIKNLIPIFNKYNKKGIISLPIPVGGGAE